MRSAIVPLKFSIVTPSLNSQDFIRETIESVIRQSGDFSIEYIVIDGCSKDQTGTIVKGYQRQLLSGKLPINCKEIKIKFVSEKDSGMYDAINKGFALATGDIFAWINSDDVYIQGSFNIIEKTFSKYPQIIWLKGVTSYIDEASNIYASGKCFLYQKELINRGLYGPILYFIQQDSVFWRAQLWNLSGGVDARLSVAGDYFLWKKFSEITPLYSLNTNVSCFRKVCGQKSENIQKYFQEINDYSGSNRNQYKLIKYYFAFEKYIPFFMQPLCYRLFLGKHKYHLVTLDKEMEPRLREGNYLMLSNIS